MVKGDGAGCLMVIAGIIIGLFVSILLIRPWEGGPVPQPTITVDR